MPYRPKAEVTTGNWLGFQPAQIIDIADRSDDYDWADVLLEVTFKIPTSQYPVIYQLKGSYEYNDDGTIKDSSLLKRIYSLFDALECQAGPDRYGKWVDEDDIAIDDIATYLNTHHISPDALTSEATPFYIYVYKENAKNGKTYTRVASKIVRNLQREKDDLESWITFMKSKGYLKEAESSTESAVHVQASASQSAQTF